MTHHQSDIILIMIYTGLRPTELLEIQTENVHLNEKYMVGGMKTKASVYHLYITCVPRVYNDLKIS